MAQFSFASQDEQAEIVNKYYIICRENFRANFTNYLISSNRVTHQTWFWRKVFLSTYQCWPSCKTIGKAVRMSANTVHKYMCELEERQLISTESTTVATRDSMKRNGNLLYTIRPIQLALDQFYEQQLAQMGVAAERQRVAKTLALRSDKRGSA